MYASVIGVLKTRASPYFSARVAASRKTPPSLLPTSCPYRMALGLSRIISFTAKSAASTITTGSLPSGLRVPFSSVIGVGANSYLYNSSGAGSGASTARWKSAAAFSSASFSIRVMVEAGTPAFSRSFFILGIGSSFACLAKSESERYHSLRTPDVW